MPKQKKYDDLREACVQEAIVIIETSGIEQLSLREVSRRLGVSHQAPYKHFPSRDHILAEVVRRVFDEFAEYLDGRPQNGDPRHDLETMGRAYLQYALERPLQYRLMFNTTLPDKQDHPDMMNSAQHAFSILHDNIARMNLGRPSEMDAMFVWSSLHGIVSILQTQIMETLDIPEEMLNQAAVYVLERIDGGLRGK